MKNVKLLITSLFLTLIPAAFAEGAPQVLVSYFSVSGNTARAAHLISDATGGTLYEIQAADPYTDDDVSYSNAKTRRPYKEHIDKTCRPALRTLDAPVKDADVIFIGFPVWNNEAPKVIYTFLESYDFTGKKIALFCTSSSSTIDNSAKELALLAPGAVWLTGRRITQSDSEDTVRAWCGTLGY